MKEFQFHTSSENKGLILGPSWRLRWRGCQGHGFAFVPVLRLPGRFLSSFCLNFLVNFHSRNRSSDALSPTLPSPYFQIKPDSASSSHSEFAHFLGDKSRCVKIVRFTRAFPLGLCVCSSGIGRLSVLVPYSFLYKCSP